MSICGRNNEDQGCGRFPVPTVLVSVRWAEIYVGRVFPNPEI